MMIRNAHKIGAVFYALWGVLHIVGGIAVLATAIGQGTRAALLSMGSGVTIGEAIADSGGPIVDAVTMFHAFNLTWMGLVVLIAAVLGNWRNSRSAYWLNLAIAGFADLGLAIFLLAPGTMRLADGLPGIILFLPALAFTTIGLYSRHAIEVEPQRAI